MTKTDFRSRLPEWFALALEQRAALAKTQGWQNVIILFSAMIVFGYPPHQPLSGVMMEVPHFEECEN